MQFARKNSNPLKTQPIGNPFHIRRFNLKIVIIHFAYDDHSDDSLYCWTLCGYKLFGNREIGKNMKTKLLILTLAFLNQSLGADSINTDFECHASQSYGSLQVSVHQTSSAYRIKLQSYRASEAAEQLGLGKYGTVDSIEVEFPSDRCSSSDNVLGVVQCRIYPNIPLKVKAFDKDGLELSQDRLSVFNFHMEKTTRLASTYEKDIKRQYIELDAFFISETDNEKRAELSVRYEISDCIKK